MQSFGFIGLGIMGTGMAHNLLKAGFKVTVYNRTAEKCAPLVEAGATQADSPAATVQSNDITFNMVSDPAAAEAVCFGPQGVLEGISAGKGYVDMSTIDPHTSAKIGAAITQKGGRFVEAPVSGSKKPAADGTLVIIAAGDQALFEECKGAFDAMGKLTVYVGDVGNAAKMKLVVNMIMGGMMTAFCEGLALTDKAGISPKDLLHILEHGAIASPMLRVKGPLILDQQFAPAFPLKHMQKDMRLALALGDEVEQPLPTAAAANQLFIKARNLDGNDLDFSAVANALQPHKA